MSYSYTRGAVSLPLMNLNKYWIFEKFLEKFNIVPYYVL